MSSIALLPPIPISVEGVFLVVDVESSDDSIYMITSLRLPEDPFSGALYEPTYHEEADFIRMNITDMTSEQRVITFLYSAGELLSREGIITNESNNK